MPARTLFVPLLLALAAPSGAARAADYEPLPLGSRADVVAGTLHDGTAWVVPGRGGAEHGPFVAFVFLGTECPMAQSYASKLSAMHERFAPRGAHVVGVMSNAQDDRAEIARFVEEQGVTFPLLLDPDATIADRFGATRTPEVFVVGPDRLVVYHGRIDDWLDRGAKRGGPTRPDLVMALEELTSGKPVGLPETPFTGCRIGRRPKPRSVRPDAVTFADQGVQVTIQGLELREIGDILQIA